ncbi:MAG: hypothetical protein V4603_02280 [Pseudomonadota bacterium]
MKRLLGTVAIARIAIVGCSLWLAGCVSHEGIGLLPPTQGAEELLYDAKQTAKATAENAETDTAALPRQFILIGTVSSLRRFSERSGDRYYERYLKFVERYHPDQAPVLSREDFSQTIAGWTNLKSFTIPLVMGLYRDVLVPASLVDTIRFPSVVGVFVAQEAGDLLAAKTNADGFFVVEAVLCADSGSEYYRCAREYEKGLFDATTGEALGMGLKPANSGQRIDLSTYKLVE